MTTYWDRGQACLQSLCRSQRVSLPGRRSVPVDGDHQFVCDDFRAGRDDDCDAPHFLHLTTNTEKQWLWKQNGDILDAADQI